MASILDEDQTHRMAAWLVSTDTSGFPGIIR